MNSSDNTANEGPLQGLKVLDFSTLLPGPYATLLLADMGAEVLRVESPSRPDLVRTMQPQCIVDGESVSYSHLHLNRNKASIALDLKRPAAVAVIKRLVAEYDVLIEQFRPGVMKKLGLDYPTLAAINPRLIYCAITGYGQDGPHRDKAGHDINYLARSGIASYSGTGETGPVLPGVQIADIAGGSHQAVMAIQAAIIQRLHSGLGRFIDVSMTDCAFALNTLFGPGALATGQSPDYGNTLLNGGSMYGYYRTADDRYLSVGGIEPQFARAFFERLGHPEWLALAGDASQQHQLRALIGQVIAREPLHTWQQCFADSDACVEPVLSVCEAAESDLMQQRQMVLTLDNGDGPPIRQIAPPVKWAGVAFRQPSPQGADTQRLLRELGYGPDKIRVITG